MSVPITNLQRAAWGNAALTGYSAAKDETSFLYDDRESVFADMISDLMHFAQACGLDFEEHIERARMHYEAEKSAEGANS